MGFLGIKNNIEKQDIIIKLTNQYFEKIDDTKKVIDTFNSVLNSNEKVIELDLSKCTHISVTGGTILAALAPLINAKKRKLIIHLNPDTQICNHFLHSEKPNEKVKTLPFSLLTNTTIKKVLDELKNIPDMRELEQSFYCEIWSRCYELCLNANEHADNSLGAACNAYCDNGYFTFTVFDFGNGILKNVKEYLDSDITTEDAVRWALEKAHSTKQSIDMPRGAGFPATINFINKYKGQMILCTGDIYCIIKNNNKHFQKLDSSIIGTLITISIRIK